MAFTFSQPRRMTPEESSPYNNLLAHALKNYQQGVTAQYAPQRQEADIFAKEMGPMAALASNPNFSFDPQVRDLISKKIADHIEKTQKKGGHEGLLNAILHKNWLGKQEEAANQAQAGNGEQQQGGMDQNGNNKFSLLPQAGQGVQAGAQAKAQAPFMSSPYAPGSLYQNPNTGEVVSAPTHEQVAAAQKAITSTKAVEPILKDLIEQAKPFLGKGGKLGLARGQVAGIARQYGAPDFITDIMGDKEKANQYAKFQTTQALAIERLMTALNLPLNQESQHTVASIVQPHHGEDEKGYGQRVRHELEIMQRNAQQGENTLGSGFNLSGGQNQGQVQGQPGNEQQGGDQSANPISGQTIIEAAQQIGVRPQQITEDAQYFGTTPDVVISALKGGIKTEEEMRDYIKELQNG